MILLLLGLTELLNNVGAGLLTAILLAMGGLFWNMSSRLAVISQILQDRDRRDEDRSKELDRRFADIIKDLDQLKMEVAELRKGKG